MSALNAEQREIARAVLHNAKVIIFDEPTAALTPEERKYFFDLARDLKKRYGFRTHKLKGGHFSPDHDVSVMEALADAFPEDLLRLDPNGAWSVERAIRVGQAIEKLKNDYFEDPTWGLEGMRRVRQFVRIPTATNTVVVNF